ncbi:MAG: site-2 protease family protein, partial [Sporomusaceae bacterium]|nr:site-2 protease family protein [Sporomusaceae bacterium]
MRVGRIGDVTIHVPLLLLVFIGFFSVVGFGSKILLLITGLLWHETAHVLVAIKLGFPVEKVELTVFGGVALAPSLGEAAVLEECLVAAAGPLASFFLAGVAFLLLHQIASELLSFYFTVNLSLALFNLLPGLPLDGGRIFRSLLALTLGYSRATVFTI